MKLFVDSANLRDIEEALKRGFPSGITTNPSIVSKEERRDFRDHSTEMRGGNRKDHEVRGAPHDVRVRRREKRLRQVDARKPTLVAMRPVDLEGDLG